VSSPIEIRKVIWGVVLGIIFVGIFRLFPDSLMIDWTGKQTIQQMTALKPIIEVIGLLVIVFYHIFNKAHPETNKLSLTAILSLCWLGLIIFFNFKDHANPNTGAVGFFALMMGLGVCVLWVRFFSDEIFA
jgi:hypothetical protein